MSAEQATPKRVRQASLNNKNAAKHGLWSARRVLNEFGLRSVDGRSAVGIALKEWRAEVVKDLGGEETLSAQQLAVLEIVIRLKLMLDSIDAWILQQPTLISKRKKTLLPVVRERNALSDSFVKHLQTLGLERRAAPSIDIVSGLASIAARDRVERAEKPEASETANGPGETENAYQEQTSSQKQAQESGAGSQ